MTKFFVKQVFKNYTCFTKPSSPTVLRRPLKSILPKRTIYTGRPSMKEKKHILLKEIRFIK